MVYSPRSKTLVLDALTPEERVELATFEDTIECARNARRRLLGRVAERIASAKVKSARAAERMAAE